MPRYTDLMNYWHCPRLYAFTLLGYIPPSKPRPITMGELAHAGLAAYFSGGSPMPALLETESKCYEMLRRIKSGEEQYKAFKDVEAASQKAQELLSRYLSYWVKDYASIAVEQELKFQGVITHPDLVALMGRRQVIVEFKTGRDPDLRFLDISGQADLAAYILKFVEFPIDLVVYDIITPEKLARHTRPPRFEAGKRLFHQVQALESFSDKVPELLMEPHPAFDCPNRCAYFTPCYLLESEGQKAAFDYIEVNYILKEEK